MHDKKMTSFESPDLRKLQAVVINARTTIFIDKDADPDEAKRLYEERHQPVNRKYK